MQGELIFRLAEKCIQTPFDIAQGGAQLINHAAHNLAVAHTPVELFHPGFQWFRRAKVNHVVKSLGQAHAA